MTDNKAPAQAESKRHNDRNIHELAKRLSGVKYDTFIHGKPGDEYYTYSVRNHEEVHNALLFRNEPNKIQQLVDEFVDICDNEEFGLTLFVGYLHELVVVDTTIYEYRGEKSTLMSDREFTDEQITQILNGFRTYLQRLRQYDTDLDSLNKLYKALKTLEGKANNPSTNPTLTRLLTAELADILEAQLKQLTHENNPYESKIRELDSEIPKLIEERQAEITNRIAEIVKQAEGLPNCNANIYNLLSDIIRNAEKVLRKMDYNGQMLRPHEVIYAESLRLEYDRFKTLLKKLIDGIRTKADTAPKESTQ